ncbi:hypothetical protein [Salinibaculum marinum]|uniref:hypothetical protein n=1 Tax=Salinibaculum marinum TaxID=3131993 RepID=UPI0030CB408C
MSPLVLILIVGGTLLVGIGFIIWLVKRGTFEPDATNTDSGDERANLSARQRAEDWSVPLRRRYKALPGPARMLVATIVVLVVALAALMYQILQSGKPLGQVVDIRMAAATIGLIGIGGGLWLERWSRDRVRYAYVFYEREGGDPDSERIPFMTDSRSSATARKSSRKSRVRASSDWRGATAR